MAHGTDGESQQTAGLGVLERGHSRFRKMGTDSGHRQKRVCRVENKGEGNKSVRAALFTRAVSAVRGVQGWALQVLGQK